jgi:hypothetical protein
MRGAFYTLQYKGYDKPAGSSIPYIEKPHRSGLAHMTEVM